MVAEPFAEAVAEAERIIAEAPHIRTEQDLLEGYDYLAGSIQRALQTAWATDPDRPRFLTAPDADTKYGLDNPDTLYFGAIIRPDTDYVVTGKRGSTADLSFQVLGGDYTPAKVPGSLAAFDDRQLEIAEDGSFEVHFGPKAKPGVPNSFPLGENAAILIIREVYSDWENQVRGRLDIRAADGNPGPPELSERSMAKRYAAAGKILVTQLRTFLKFPEWFYYDRAANEMTAPRRTPGGLATQFSSVGHYELAADKALIVEVPKSEAPYQGFQLGSLWYISTDYIHAQTSLTAEQARADPDGMLRFVVSERDPGVANWLACTGHERGYLQIRWQRLDRELTEADGPRTELVDLAELPERLPYYQHARITGEQRAHTLEARRAAIARRRFG
ncbi:hypothetical protein [Sciscionella sediminilitoris]|uniref:hypothetical protein n=1 Tax=Sciscionella sediminilitoris TaxID=1445613 RepID=UPI0004DFC149|nr:hypothetical protein [Sciscionella sp. SE31]